MQNVNFFVFCQCLILLLWLCGHHHLENQYSSRNDYFRQFILDFFVENISISIYISISIENVSLEWNNGPTFKCTCLISPPLFDVIAYLSLFFKSFFLPFFPNLDGKGNFRALSLIIEPSFVSFKLSDNTVRYTDLSLFLSSLPDTPAERHTI